MNRAFSPQTLATSLLLSSFYKERKFIPRAREDTLKLLMLIKFSTKFLHLYFFLPIYFLITVEIARRAHPSIVNALIDHPKD